MKLSKLTALLIAALTLAASPAVAYHKKTCLDWVKFLTGAVTKQTKLLSNARLKPTRRLNKRPHGPTVDFNSAGRQNGESTRQIAADIGVDRKTVDRDLAGTNVPENGTNVPPSTRELLSQSDQNDWRTPRKYLDAADVRGVTQTLPAP